MALSADQQGRPDPDVLVVGGGIAGLFSAYYLRLAGHSVTVLERGRIGDQSACSSGNTGFVGFGGRPLAGPGALGAGVRSLLRPDDRLGLSPTVDLDRLRWLQQLRRAGGPDQVRAVTATMLELKRHSLQLLAELAGGTAPLAGFTPTGMLQAFRSQHAFDQACRAIPVAVDQGVPVRALTTEQLHALEPDCEFEIAGATYNELGGILHAPAVLSGLTRRLRELGAAVVEDCPVDGFEFGGGRVIRLRTGAGEFRPSEVVVAAGSWSGPLARQLGLRLPLQPIRGYAVNIEQPVNAPRHPVLLVEGTVAMRVLDGQLRLAGDLSLAGQNRTIRRRRVDRLIRTVHEHLPAVQLPAQPRIWAGLRPCTPDSLPMVGRVPGWHNLSIATGHGHNGMGLAPSIGQLLAQLLDGKPTTIEARPLRVDRFQLTRGR